MLPSVKSQLSLRPFIAIVFPPFMLFVILGIPKIANTIDDLQNGSHDITGILLPILFLFFTGFLIMRYLRHLPHLYITKEGVIFKVPFATEKYAWNCIKSISVNERRKLPVFFHAVITEAIIFHFKDGSEKKIWTYSYSNGSVMAVIFERAEAILQQTDGDFNSLDLSPSDRTYAPAFDETDEKKIFSGSHFQSINGIAFYLILVITLYYLFQPIDVIRKIIVCIAALGFATMISSTMNYFIVTNRNLIVRNNLWYWKYDIYPIDSIRKAVIEVPYRGSITLRLTLQDFEIKAYQSSSLKTRTWKKLITALEQKNVPVKNEAF